MRVAITTLSVWALVSVGCSKSDAPKRDAKVVVADSGQGQDGKAADAKGGDIPVGDASYSVECESYKIGGAETLPTTPNMKVLGDKQLLNYKYKGNNRPYLLHLPTGYDGTQSLPVIFAFHGGGSESSVFYARLSRLKIRANKDKIILVFPQGVWRVYNGGGCCFPAVQCNFDDLGYIRELASYLQSALKVDAKRIYAMGYSNGGYLSHRVGAEMSDLFAAVSVGAGAIGGSYPGLSRYQISAKSPLPIIMHHGDSDVNVVFAGGTVAAHSGPEVGRQVISFADSVRYWVTNNGCDATPAETTPNEMVIRSFSKCTQDADVVSMVIKGHGHSWPSINDTGGFDVVGAIVDFFGAHPKK